MKSITLTRFDPEPPDDPQRWQVGYDAVLEDGREVHSVTTVYRQQAPSGERADVLTIAEAAILPGLLIQNREALAGLPQEPEPFDPTPAEVPPAPSRAVPATPATPPATKGHSHGSKS